MFLINRRRQFQLSSGYKTGATRFNCYPDRAICRLNKAPPECLPIPPNAKKGYASEPQSACNPARSMAQYRHSPFHSATSALRPHNIFNH